MQAEPRSFADIAAAFAVDDTEQATERAGYDAELIDALRAQGVKATFFAGGKWLRTHPEQAMQLMADPRFEIGNHAWTHANLRVVEGAAARDPEVVARLVWRALGQPAPGQPAPAQPPRDVHTAPAIEVSHSSLTLSARSIEALDAVADDVQADEIVSEIQRGLRSAPGPKGPFPQKK